MYLFETIMHSSRVHTAACWRIPGGLPRGGSASRGVCLGVCLGGSASGGSASRILLPGGLPRGSASRGVCLAGSASRWVRQTPQGLPTGGSASRVVGQTPYPPVNRSHTCVKTLPCPKLRLRAVKRMFRSIRNCFSRGIPKTRMFSVFLEYDWIPYFFLFNSLQRNVQNLPSCPSVHGKYWSKWYMIIKGKYLSLEEFSAI